MTSPSLGAAEAVTTIVIEGPCTLAEAPRWREALLRAFSTAKPVRLDLAGSGPWDLAGLQLLLATLAQGTKLNQGVELVNVPNVCLTLAEESGLIEVLGRIIVSRIE